MSFTIERFSSDDKQAFLTLSDMADPWAVENGRPAIPESNWQSLISKDGGLHGYALKRNGEVAGYVLYCFCACIKTVRDECQVRDVFVLPEYRRQGGGTLLMRAVHDDAQKQNADRVFWFANPSRKDAVAFHGTFGSQSAEMLGYFRWLGHEAEQAA